MQRVAVIGAVGAGKSTFSRSFADRSGLPLAVLDDLYWRAGPIPSDEEWARKHDTIVASDRWVIDGDHRAVAPARFARADTVIWIDPPLPRRWCNIVWRARLGDPAGFWNSLRWTTRYQYVGRRQTVAALASMSPRLAVHRLRTRRAQRAFLNTATY